jgi:transcriptional regulator with XRE-family HTH domain
MGAGTSVAISQDRLFEDYHINLYGAYHAMRDAFDARDITQDELAARLDTDKALISKRLNGKENLTLRTLSYMATGLKCRVTITFTPYENIGSGNYFTTVNSGIDRPVKTSNVSRFEKI